MSEVTRHEDARRDAGDRGAWGGDVFPGGNTWGRGEGAPIVGAGVWGVRPASPCVMWDGRPVDAYGYGLRYRARGTKGPKCVLAHRWAWQEAHGRPVPAGLYVCHACDVPGCVNPAHLFVGTARDNTRDAMAKGRHVTPPKQRWCRRGHEISEVNGHRRCRACHVLHMRRYRARAPRRVWGGA
jgi:hypothetical protein